MSEQPITVDNKLFLGRNELQDDFRQALRDVLFNDAGEETNPYIFLLYGNGGMGKTTLAKRYQDIASYEQPFEGNFQILRLDWEREREKNNALQVGKENIRIEDVFDVLYNAIIRQGWERHFKDYRKALNDRQLAEQKAAKIIDQASQEDQFATLRGANAAAIARIIRSGAPMIGSTGEALAAEFLNLGIKAIAEQAAILRASIETRLKASLDIDQYQLFLNPHEQLAYALAQGFKNLTRQMPLLVILDTYEIVDAVDVWLRVLLKAAGTQVVWVIAGRKDLTRNYGNFHSYHADFPSRLYGYNMPQLAKEYIQTYFNICVPNRPLSEQEVEVISTATHGIPLAVKVAAEIWESGALLEELAGDINDSTPRREIVQTMMERYRLHVLKEQEDKRALYALALARGDVEILRAMLRPADEKPFDLENYLIRLSNKYAPVLLHEYKLHDEPESFFIESLQEKIHRTSDEICALNRAAVETLQSRLQKWEGSLPGLEDRYEDEDWLQDVLNLAHYLFWLDQNRAWQWVAPRFLEGQVYNRTFARSLLETISAFKSMLSAAGKKRLRIWQAGMGYFVDAEEEQAMLNSLENTARLGWLQGAHQAERKALLTFLQGKLAAKQGEVKKAMQAFEGVFPVAQSDDTLKTQLADAYENLGHKLGWKSDGSDSLPSENAEICFKQAIKLGKNTSSIFHSLGAVQYKLGKLEVSKEHLKKAIQLDQNYAHPWNGLGNVYDDLGQHEQAIEAYQKAIHLDQNYATPWNGLGNVYRKLGQHEQAIDAYQKAIQLDQSNPYVYSNLAGTYLKQKDFVKAKEYFQKRIDRSPKDAMYAYLAQGIIATKNGQQVEAAAWFEKCLETWEYAWTIKLQTPYELLTNKAIAQLCLGDKQQALHTLAEAVDALVPGDVIPYYLYEILQSAPNPPEGIEEMIAILKEAEEKRTQPKS